jgi:hypothetical protein
VNLSGKAELKLLNSEWEQQGSTDLQMLEFLNMFATKVGSRTFVDACVFDLEEKAGRDSKGKVVPALN